MVDHVADAVVELEQEEHLLRERVDPAREVALRDLEHHARVARRERRAQAIPLVELAHALHQQRAGRGQDARGELHAVRA